MPEIDPAGFRPRQEASSYGVLTAVLVALLVLAGGWWFWWRPLHTQPSAPVVAPAPAVAPQPDTPPEEPVGPPDAAAANTGVSTPQNPVDALAAPQAGLPELKDSDAAVQQALQDLWGGKQVLGFLQIDGLIHRTVATLDNLTRAHAPSRVWPVQPTPGRFAVHQNGTALTIDPANAQRYQAFVALAEALPLDAGVRLYARFYPLFQQAYEELGFPGHYFNDRLVAVLDHLLATPDPVQPVAVKLVQVEGDVPSTRPWVRYEFADAQLQGLSSGQKLLIRMGADNARRLKVVLKELRSRVATGKLARQPG